MPSFVVTTQSVQWTCCKFRHRAGVLNPQFSASSGKFHSDSIGNLRVTVGWYQPPTVNVFLTDINHSTILESAGSRRWPTWSSLTSIMTQLLYVPPFRDFITTADDLFFLTPPSTLTSPPLDNIRVTVIVWRLRGNIIRTAPCWVVWHNVHSQQHTHMSSSYRSSRLDLSHWDPYAMHRGSCLELYYCNMVEWSWWDSSLICNTN